MLMEPVYAIDHLTGAYVVGFIDSLKQFVYLTDDSDINEKHILGGKKEGALIHKVREGNYTVLHGLMLMGIDPSSLIEVLDFATRNIKHLNTSYAYKRMVSLKESLQSQYLEHYPTIIQQG